MDLGKNIARGLKQAIAVIIILTFTIGSLVAFTVTKVREHKEAQRVEVVQDGTAVSKTNR